MIHIIPNSIISGNLIVKNSSFPGNNRLPGQERMLTLQILFVHSNSIRAKGIVKPYQLLQLEVQPTQSVATPLSSGVKRIISFKSGNYICST